MNGRNQQQAGFQAEQKEGHGGAVSFFLLLFVPFIYAFFMPFSYSDALHVLLYSHSRVASYHFRLYWGFKDASPFTFKQAQMSGEAA